MIGLLRILPSILICLAAGGIVISVFHWLAVWTNGLSIRVMEVIFYGFILYITVLGIIIEISEKFSKKKRRYEYWQPRPSLLDKDGGLAIRRPSGPGCKRTERPQGSSAGPRNRVLLRSTPF